MTTARPPVDLVTLDELAELAGVDDVRLADHLVRRAVLPATAGLQGGRGVRKRWPATDATALRILARLAGQGCPDVWLEAVAAWWARVDHDAVADRVIAVVPTRDPAVFCTTRANVGGILGGRDGWIVDLGRPIPIAHGTRRGR